MYRSRDFELESEASVSVVADRLREAFGTKQGSKRPRRSQMNGKVVRATVTDSSFSLWIQGWAYSGAKAHVTGRLLASSAGTEVRATVTYDSFSFILPVMLFATVMTYVPAGSSWIVWVDAGSRALLPALLLLGLDVWAYVSNREAAERIVKSVIYAASPPDSDPVSAMNRLQSTDDVRR